MPQNEPMTTEKPSTQAEQHPLLHALMPEVDTTESVVDVHDTPLEPIAKPLASFAPTERPTNLWLRIWMEIYLISYGLGAFTSDVWHTLIDWIAALCKPPLRAIAQLWRRTVVKQWGLLRFELRRIRYGFTLAHLRVGEAKERHRLLGVLQMLVLPFVAIRRHRRIVSAVTQTVMVVVSVVALTLVIRYWSNTTFALELVYGGQRLGYITDESVFTDALDMAENRIIIKDPDGHIIDRDSSLTLRPVQQSRVLSTTELCDVILQMSVKDVEEMSGLYVDGVFIGALREREEMDRLLKEVLNFYDTGVDTVTKRVEFRNHVEVLDGLYPMGTDEPYMRLRQKLTKIGEDGTPFLTVQVRSTEVYTEPIPYDKRTVKDNSKYIGYVEIHTKGEEGKKQITADVIYVNGEPLYREILREEVVKEPVTEVTVEGSYRVNPNAEPGVATGSFMWPLPSCRMVSSPFGTRWGKLHAGIDISGNGVTGKPIIAADGGVVTQANTEGWGGGYGLYVVVDHGNGYVTTYSHCDEILVEVGQRVAQGEVIAKAGNTGNSTGPHLHFEIRINGTAVDPLPYLK